MHRIRALTPFGDFVNRTLPALVIIDVLGAGAPLGLKLLRDTPADLRKTFLLLQGTNLLLELFLGRSMLDGHR